MPTCTLKTQVKKLKKMNKSINVQVKEIKFKAFKIKNTQFPIIYFSFLFLHLCLIGTS